MSFTYLPYDCNQEDLNQFYLSEYGVTYQSNWITDSLGQSQEINTQSFQFYKEMQEFMEPSDYQMDSVEHQQNSINLIEQQVNTQKHIDEFYDQFQNNDNVTIQDQSSEKQDTSNNLLNEEEELILSLEKFHIDDEQFEGSNPNKFLNYSQELNGRYLNPNTSMKNKMIENPFNFNINQYSGQKNKSNGKISHKQNNNKISIERINSLFKTTKKIIKIKNQKL